MKADILAFGVHPDDVELSCAGTLIASIAQGKTAVVIDLTAGELGTRGTAATRKKEAADAAKVMGIHKRENLGMADGFFKHDEKNTLKIIQVIRRYQPEIILCNAPEDRHPDHGRSAKLVSDAVFLAGLRKIVTHEQKKIQKAWRTPYTFHYIQDRYIKPDFLFDISAYHDQKLKAILCYKTQFNTKDHAEPATYISSPEFFESLKARALIMGKQIGVSYAEGFISQKLPGINSFDAFIKKAT
ncbi:MAG: bacillithiol biosynthesis deacetylase BshB1 [Bacteroidetes bacterium]|nr:bacillithiol biosynthesis deacetylase BshB1 [Bacteroidota bacterium]